MFNFCPLWEFNLIQVFQHNSSEDLTRMEMFARINEEEKGYRAKA